jgi:hypothetical protein
VWVHTAGAYAYLERFVAEFDSSHSLALLPNYAFALPMARFRLEQAQQQQAAAGGSNGGQHQQQAAADGSSAAVSSLTLLAQALLLHPLVLVELLGKLQGQGAAREEAWQQLKKRTLYTKVGGFTFVGSSRGFAHCPYSNMHSHSRLSTVTKQQQAMARRSYKGVCRPQSCLWLQSRVFHDFVIHPCIILHNEVPQGSPGGVQSNQIAHRIWEC